MSPVGLGVHVRPAPASGSSNRACADCGLNAAGVQGLRARTAFWDGCQGRQQHPFCFQQAVVLLWAQQLHVRCGSKQVAAATDAG